MTLEDFKTKLQELGLQKTDRYPFDTGDWWSSPYVVNNILTIEDNKVYVFKSVVIDNDGQLSTNKAHCYFSFDAAYRACVEVIGKIKELRRTLRKQIIDEL